MGKINAEWHRKHKSPRDAAGKEKWRKDHKKNCECRS